MCANFQAKRTTLTFWAQIWPKNGFWGRDFKNLSLDSESAPPRYHVCQFSVKVKYFEFFGLNLGKLLNYVRHFGSNIVAGVVESWVEAEMSWVEVGGGRWRWMELSARFSNTRYYLDSSRAITLCIVLLNWIVLEDQHNIKLMVPLRRS